MHEKFTKKVYEFWQTYSVYIPDDKKKDAKNSLMDLVMLDIQKCEVCDEINSN